MFKKILPLVFFIVSAFQVYTQEIGANFNHNPETIDYDYLKKSQVDWIRTTPRILDYIEGKLNIDNDPALQKIIEAGEKGYKVAFGFRWDFRKRQKRLPKPGSKEEQLYFAFVKKILKKVGPYVHIFKLGNEPNLETLSIDQIENDEGIVPLVQFTKRQLTEVILPYFESENRKLPEIYVGSFPRLFMKKEQENPGVFKMIEFAQNDSRIAGLAVHLHISDTLQIEQSFRFVRSIMPEKPIIIPEFSLHRLYINKLSEKLTSNIKGAEFVKKYNRNPNWKLYQWFGHANKNQVTADEWSDFFNTLEWYPKNNLKIFYNQFKKYGIVLATYPIFQQSCPKNMTPKSPAWFINPIFCQKSLVKKPNGAYSENPLHYSDFIEIVKQGKK